MPNTTKGYPYPEGSDAVDVPGDIQALADAVDAAPGVTSYTSTQIAGLAAGEKWAGRVIWNSTAGKLQVSNGSTFSDVDTSVALSSSTPQTLGTAAAGTSSDASRADHRHAMPSASDVGAVANSLVSNTKGAVPVGTGSAVAALSPGSNGQMLMADSGATNGLRYVDPPANRNLIINGEVGRVAQRGTTVTGATNSGYRTADRWQVVAAGVSVGTWTESVENDAPTGSGLRKSTKLLWTTARSTPAASDLMLFRTVLEGQDLQRIRKGTSDAQQLTLSFWVKSNVTGTYVARVEDADNNRHVGSTYSVSASGTWERKVITFPADTTGAFDNNNEPSMRVDFGLIGGTDWSSGTLPSTWASVTTATIIPGQVNVAAATNNYWQVTGVQLETGPVATPFEFEPFEATLRKCQRYYYVHAEGNDVEVCTCHYYNATYVMGSIFFPTTMRTAPTGAAVSGTNYYRIDRNNGQDDTNAFDFVVTGPNTARLANNTEVSGTAGQAGSIKTFNAAARIAFSAEL